jgi:hypothetical protein
MPTPSTPPHPDGLVLRIARPDDDAALVRLAALEGAPPLAGPVLVAEENGAIAAALCLSTACAVADPFVPSAHLVELLRQHAARRHAPAAAPRGRHPLPRLALRGAELFIGGRLSR